VDELGTTNLVDIFNVVEYFVAPPRPCRLAWEEGDVLEKKEDLGRPSSPSVLELTPWMKPSATSRASVNIMPKVIYKKIHG
jgi:hypothetical protein